jgi:hypothetical protein
MPSQHVLNVIARGLVTSPNPLAIPKDALLVADNVVLERPGFIQSRRGWKKYTNVVGGDVWAVAPFQGRIVANYGMATAATFIRVNTSNDGTGAWTAVSGTFTNVVTDNARMRTAEVLGYLYLTCAQGVQRLDTSNVATPAGLPKAIGFDLAGPANVLTGSGGFLADTQCVAYRALVGRALGGIPQFGSPSSRVVVANAAQTSGYSSGVAKNTVVRVLLPKANNTASTALTTDYFVQLYRSGQVANGQTPSDEMQLVFEAYLTAGDIAAGYVDVTDKQPDALRGANLYTNPNTGEEGVRVGILNANDPTPAAWDVAWWRDCAWYAANELYQGRQRIQFQILGTGTGGLAVGDVLTIAGRTYTGIVPGAPSAGQFVVETAYAASVNIERTATNLVAAINKDTGNTGFYAYYVSGAAPDAPGKILLETRLETGTGLSGGLGYTGSSPNAFAPSLSAAALPSRYLQSNQLWFSKPGQPEAVPSVNFLEVGPTGSSILRIVPLGNQLYVLSTSGTYRILGDNFLNFTVDPVDLTAICAAPSSATTLDGSLFFLTSQGAVEVTEGAVAYISGPIDSDFRTLLQSLLYDAVTDTSPLSLYAFAVSHAFDHRVMFWLPYSTSSTDCHAAYVWDTRAKVWSRYYRGSYGSTALAFSCGCYSQSGPTAAGLTFAEQNGAASTDLYCYTERRDFADTDYQDSVATKATTDPIYRIVKWAYQDGGDASAGKHWREVQFLFGESRPLNVTVAMDTEIQDANDVPEASTTSTTYTTQVNNKMHRLPVGQACGRAARLGVQLECTSKEQGFDVAGFAVHFRAFGPRLTRGP